MIRRVMLSCGEASGDLYAGALTRALRERQPDIDVFGFGGPQLEAAGATLLGDYRGVSVTGLVEALRVLPQSWRMLRTLGDAARTRRPDVFVAIDFPDFNFRLLPVMRRLGVRVVYYISPQLWAWRAGRLETIKKYVDKMLVIFPFEEEIYARAGVPVEFVGHPLIDLASSSRPRAVFLPSLGLDATAPTVALLPGSRRNEIANILPGLVASMPLIRANVPDVQFVVARAPSLDDGLFAPIASAAASGLRVAIVAGAADDVLAASDLVLTASGTATVQTALHGRPMIVVYRVSPMTYRIAKRFVRVQTFAMVNLVAGRTVAPELIQAAFTPEAVAREAISLLTDRARVERMSRDLADVRSRLGGSGASGRAADAVLRLY